jgi:hypothetical protein
MVREAELDELRKKATEIRDTVDIKKHVQNAIDPTGSIRDALTSPSILAQPNDAFAAVPGSEQTPPAAEPTAAAPVSGPVVYDPASGALAPTDPVVAEASAGMTDATTAALSAEPKPAGEAKV